MLPDRVSKLGPLTYESGALPIALCGPSIEEYNFDIFPWLLFYILTPVILTTDTSKYIL